MDFGAVNLEGLVGRANGGSSQLVSDQDATKGNSDGSGLLKQERSGCDEDGWRSSKMARTAVGVDAVNTMLHQPGTPLLRSNSLLSDDAAQHQNMLSFSSPKSEVPLLISRKGGLAGRNTQSPLVPYYQQTPYAYTRNTGYAPGGFNAGMQGSLPGMRGPFTPSQWIELEHQALIYKYIMANVPVPSNLLIALKKSVNPFGLSGSSSGVYTPNSFGWGSFHLGFNGNTDPEPGRCRRTDGKKWRCSRDAVADQKYCERHINRGRHRSRKHVEGQTGHAVSGSTTSKLTPVASSLLATATTSSCASNTLSVMQPQFKGLQCGAANPSPDAFANRTQDPQGLPMIPPVNMTSKNSPFLISKQHVPLQEGSQSEFGIVSSDCLLNPSHGSSYVNSGNYSSFLDFNDQKTHEQHLLHQFIDDWPKDRSNRTSIAWPEDWTQLSMSLPMTSDFSPTSPSAPPDKSALSPLRLSHELDNVKMGLGLIGSTQKQTNCLPVAWGSSMGGPLGEVLNRTSSTMEAIKSSPAHESWDGSPQLWSSPTGVLQKTTFVSLSNSSSGGSPRAGKKSNDGGSLCDDVLGSTLASSFSIPSL